MKEDFSNMVLGATSEMKTSNDGLNFVRQGEDLCQIVGGHTVEGELSLGFAVNALVRGDSAITTTELDKGKNATSNGTGEVKGEKVDSPRSAEPVVPPPTPPPKALGVFKKVEGGSIRTGQVVILTKPLGSGIIQAGVMRNACKGTWYEELLTHLETSNQAAAEIIQKMSVKYGEKFFCSCTDVTGFGVAGHLCEMLKSIEDKMIVLDTNTVPIYTGTFELMTLNVYSSLYVKNLQSFAKKCGGIDANNLFHRVLFDPQTSGGLVFTVGEEYANELCTMLRAASGSTMSRVIGRVVSKNSKEYSNNDSVKSTKLYFN